MQGSGKVYKAVRNREECRSPCYPCNERKNLQPDRKKRSRKDYDHENASWIHCLQMILAVSEAHTCENSLEEHGRAAARGYTDSSSLPYNKNERICCAVDCHCCSYLTQCDSVKFRDGRILSMVCLLFSCNGALIHPGLSKRNVPFSYQASSEANCEYPLDISRLFDSAGIRRSCFLFPGQR